MLFFSRIPSLKPCKNKKVNIEDSSVCVAAQDDLSINCIYLAIEKPHNIVTADNSTLRIADRFISNL